MNIISKSINFILVASTLFLCYCVYEVSQEVLSNGKTLESFFDKISWYHFVGVISFFFGLALMDVAVSFFESNKEFSFKSSATNMKNHTLTRTIPITTITKKAEVSFQPIQTTNKKTIFAIPFSSNNLITNNIKKEVRQEEKNCHTKSCKLIWSKICDCPLYGS